MTKYFNTQGTQTFVNKLKFGNSALKTNAKTLVGAINELKIMIDNLPQPQNEVLQEVLVPSGKKYQASALIPDNITPDTANTDSVICTSNGDIVYLQNSTIKYASSDGTTQTVNLPNLSSNNLKATQLVKLPDNKLVTVCDMYTHQTVEGSYGTTTEVYTHVGTSLVSDDGINWDVNNDAPGLSYILHSGNIIIGLAPNNNNTSFGLYKYTNSTWIKITDVAIGRVLENVSWDIDFNGNININTLTRDISNTTNYNSAIQIDSSLTNVIYVCSSNSDYITVQSIDGTNLIYSKGESIRKCTSGYVYGNETIVYDAYNNNNNIYHVAKIGNRYFGFGTRYIIYSDDGDNWAVATYFNIDDIEQSNVNAEPMYYNFPLIYGNSSKYYYVSKYGISSSIDNGTSWRCEESFQSTEDSVAIVGYNSNQDVWYNSLKITQQTSIYNRSRTPLPVIKKEGNILIRSGEYKSDISTVYINSWLKEKLNTRTCGLRISKDNGVTWTRLLDSSSCCVCGLSYNVLTVYKVSDIDDSQNGTTYTDAGVWYSGAVRQARNYGNTEIYTVNINDI